MDVLILKYMFFILLNFFLKMYTDNSILSSFQFLKKLLPIQSLSMYLLDLTLPEITFVHFYHSLQAASAIYLSRELLGCDVIWDRAFAHYTKYSESDLNECVKAMKRTLSKTHKSKFSGARQKYEHHDFHCISKHRVLLPAELWPKDEDKDH